MINRTEVTVRKALPSDVNRIFEWRNLDEIVALSQLQKSVTWEEHLAWFNHAVSSDAHAMYLIMLQGEEVGLCRFQHEGNLSVLSIYLVSPHHKKGIGSIALMACINNEKNKHSIFHAHVRFDNMPSRQFFAKNGFSMINEDGELVTYELRIAANNS